ncbi:MAG TPA: prepilin-type N-terminal cleavage/methylation domain-containing protein [Candidatus Paceibacterota bacterium]
MTYKSKKQRGFTLVEAMVAISILSLAVTGPLVIAQKGLGSSIYARDQITAFYLAQEAVEYIRNVRDSNRITGTAWLSQFSACKEDGSGRKCQIDSRYADFSTGGAISSCSSGVCPILSLDTTNNIYGYGSGVDWRPTMFTRIISINETVLNKEAEISVTISWNTKLFTPLKTFTIREYIFNF